MDPSFTFLTVEDVLSLHEDAIDTWGGTHGIRDLIRRALAQTRGNRTRAAELVEISHRALLYEIKEYGI
jgi:hypothetical protein